MMAPGLVSPCSASCSPGLAPRRTASPQRWGNSHRAHSHLLGSSLVPRGAHRRCHDTGGTLLGRNCRSTAVGTPREGPREGRRQGTALQHGPGALHQPPAGLTPAAKQPPDFCQALGTWSSTQQNPNQITGAFYLFYFFSFLQKDHSSQLWCLPPRVTADWQRCCCVGVRAPAGSGTAVPCPSQTPTPTSGPSVLRDNIVRPC